MTTSMSPRARCGGSRLVRRQREDLDAAVRRLLLDLRHQPRQEQLSRKSLAAMRKVWRAVAGLEAARVGEHRPAGRRMRPGASMRNRHRWAPCRRPNAPEGVPATPEFLQRSTHRRLGMPSRMAARHAALGQHGMEDPDEMKVDLVEKAWLSHTVANIVSICGLKCLACPEIAATLAGGTLTP